MTSLRSTPHGLHDRYRGVQGHRRIVFIHRDDLRLIGMHAGDWDDLISVYDDGHHRTVEEFLLVEYDIPRGCLASYFPETNCLVALTSVAIGAGTPTSKSIPVVLRASAAVPSPATRRDGTSV